MYCEVQHDVRLSCEDKLEQTAADETLGHCSFGFCFGILKLPIIANRSLNSIFWGGILLAVVNLQPFLKSQRALYALVLVFTQYIQTEQYNFQNVTILIFRVGK